MIKKLLVGLILAIFLAGAVTAPLLATTADDYVFVGGIRYLPGDEVISERGRNHRVYYEGDATYRAEFVGSPEFTKSNGEWVDYVFTNTGSYYQVQHPWSSARFYDYYTEVWNEEFTEVRVYDDRWSIEYQNKQGEWIDADFYSVNRSYEIVSDGIKLKRTGNTDIGQRVDTYYYRNGSPCKIEIKITPTEAQTVRYIWNQSGIVASGELGEIDEETGKTKGMRFTNASGKNVWICRWIDELDIVDTVDVVAESHAQGRKAIIIFESISVGAYESAVLDPSTYYPDDDPETNSVDGYVGADINKTSWENLIADPGNVVSTAATYGYYIKIKSSTDSAKWIQLYRSVFLFYTAGLPDGCTITAATLSFRGYSKTDELNEDPDINVYSSAPASNTNLVEGDFDSLGDIPFSTAIAYHTWDEAGWNDFALNAAGIAAISKTGVSKFGLRNASYDVSGSRPSWSSDDYSRIYAYFADGPYKPKLIVTYTPVASPTVTTQAVSAITDTTGTGNGNITAVNNGTCDKRGIVYGTTSKGDPGVAAPPSGYDDYEEQTGSFGTGAFTRSLTGLTPGQIYYVRAYAHNAIGYNYGDEVNFYTLPGDPSNLSATTISDTQIDLTWTKGTGGDKTMVRRKEGSYPTGPADGDQAYFDTGVSKSDTGRSPSTLYYYRAWAYDTEGAQYSSGYSQDTATTYGPPWVATNAATLVEETTATLNGEITAVNSANVITKGFEWDIDTGAPYANDWHQNGDFGVEAFNHALSSLTKGELYYYGAYATNTYGTGYGSEVTFLTKPDEPNTLVATAVSGTQIDLTWAKGIGAQKTYIRGKDGSYPADRTDGYEVYFDTGTSTSDTGLTGGHTYYYKAWSYATEGGKEQYSDLYDHAYDTPGLKLQLWIQWENSSTFTDLSDGGHNATPAFRTTSSDADVSVTSSNFRPIKEAVLSGYSTEDVPGMLTEVPEAPPMYTEMEVAHLPGAEAINEMLENAGIPLALFWIPLAYGFAALAALISYRWVKSMLLISIIAGTVIGFFAATGMIPLWSLIIFAVIAVGLNIAEKQMSW